MENEVKANCSKAAAISNNRDMTSGLVDSSRGRTNQLLTLAAAGVVASMLLATLIVIRDYAEASMASLAGFLPVGYAFGAGMVASVNPCGFFMLPSYLSYYLGTEREGYLDTPVVVRLGGALVLALVATTGFVLVFASFGSIIALGGGVLATYFPIGGLLVGVGMVSLGAWLFISQKPFGIMMASRVVITPQRNLINVFLFGLAYAIGSLSCTLPIFLVVVGTSLATQGVGTSFGQFLGYSLGMGTVLAAATVGTALFRDAVSRSLKGILPYIRTSSSLFLVAAGGYVVYYWLHSGALFL